MTSGFNYSDAVKRVCADIVFRLPAFSQIDLDCVGFSFCQTRNAGHYGVWASMTPLRFEGGAIETVRFSARWRYPQIILPGTNKPLLYVLSLYVPRFIDLSLSDKIDTLIHELYHINDAFDGDVRRFPGAHRAHGSMKEYNRKVELLSKQWLASDPNPQLWDFLRYDFKTLTARYSKIFGIKINLPKPVKVR